MGLNGTLAMASRSLEVFSAGIQVAGGNISNASTPGYIRETLLLEPGDPYVNGGLIFGTGVTAGGVVQEIDLFLETRLHAANSDATASQARNRILQQLEAEIRELGDHDLSTKLNDFLASIQGVVNQPESESLRQLVVQQGVQLAGDIASMRVGIDDLRRAQSVKIDQLVEEANELIDQIASLNPQISKLEASGLLRSDAGALRTQRYNALNRLSEIIPIRFEERQDGSVDVFTSSDYLVLAGQRQHLETVPRGDRDVTVIDVRLSVTKSLLSSNASSGELRGIIDGRDVVLGGFVDDLNAFSSSLIFEFNQIHSSGEGLEGFSTVTGASRVDDTALSLNDPAAGLAFTPQHGSFQLKVVNQLSGQITTSNVSVDLDGIGSETTLNSLRAALDGIANVSATITTDGRLKIDAGANYEIRFSNDTSGALAALGINTFFTGADSGSIGVNSLVANNQALFATSQGGGPGDSRNVVLLAGFNENSVAGLGGRSLDEFYEFVVTKIAQSSAAEAALAEGFDAFRTSLRNQREQFSGVSLDEEAIKVLEFQRAFQAAARIISAVDELFTTLLTM